MIKEKEKEEIHCHYCNCLLQESDIEQNIEGDDIWVFMLNDGEGGEAICCKSCHEKYQ